jgi:phytoene synthase
MTWNVMAYPSPMAEAPEEAAAVLQKHGKSFHFAGQLLDGRTFERCARLYRFCRFVDDLGDTAPASTDVAATLRRVKADLDAGRSDDPRVADLLKLASECGFDHAPAGALVEGILGDLGEVRLRDERELDRYAYRVAGTVGLLMCGVFEVRHERAFHHAIDLGMAMQFTNIARDVSEDAALGRRYVPASFFDRTPTLSELATGGPEARSAIRGAVLHLLEKADIHYRSGIAGLAYLPWRARMGILVAAKVYQAIGSRIRALDGKVWEGRAMVSPGRKVAIAAMALTRFFISGGLTRIRGEHEAHLHQHLDGLPLVHRPDPPPKAS